jgi:hypothetical protein
MPSTNAANLNIVDSKIGKIVYQFIGKVPKGFWEDIKEMKGWYETYVASCSF